MACSIGLSRIARRPGWRSGSPFLPCPFPLRLV
nr:MAG TPA: hypothetical protein [Caudoviricetes sp.]